MKMTKKEKAQDILDMIRKRQGMPERYSGWINKPYPTEPQPPEPLSESRWADFNRNFVESIDGEIVGSSGYSTQAFFDKLVELGDPEYKEKKQSEILRKMLEELDNGDHEEKVLEDLQKLDCFEAIRPEDLYE